MSVRKRICGQLAVCVAVEVGPARLHVEARRSSRAAWRRKFAKRWRKTRGPGSANPGHAETLLVVTIEKTNLEERKARTFQRIKDAMRFRFELDPIRMTVIDCFSDSHKCK